MTNEYTHQETSDMYTDFSSIRGHKEIKRVLEIAATGGHHVLLTGPPGCGKTMLADAFYMILTDLENDEMLETYGILLRRTEDFLKDHLTRHPHHSASAVSLIRGYATTADETGEITSIVQDNLSNPLLLLL